MSRVRFIHITPEAERVMAYCARVSSSNQESADLKLLSYCVKNGHWSVFEMASMCLEITTSRGISPQILRHRSFQFQEFSQRYASPSDVEIYPARRQDVKNRQNSIDDLPTGVMDGFERAQREVWEFAKDKYDKCIDHGIAKECARFLLPMNVQTRIYMHGTVRSWIHYLQARTAEGVQKEHRDIALAARDIFTEQLPIVSAAVWS